MLFLFLRKIIAIINASITVFLKLNSTIMIITLIIDFLLKPTNYV